MSRYVSYLIDDVRESTENTDFSDTIGIKNPEFLRYINDAQKRIQNLIVTKHPQVFLAEKTYSVVANQQSYDLPPDAFMGNKVSQVEYSYKSTGNDYFYPLRPGSLYERVRGTNNLSLSRPVKYIRKSGKVILVPTPTSSNGQIIITYVQKVPTLDLRRGSVASVTLDSSTNTISALNLDVSTDSVDNATLSKYTRISFCDEEGNISMSNVKVISVDASTGIVTVDPSFTYNDGETISVGDYVTAGPYSTTHTTMDELVERYLIAYATAKILQRDSNVPDLSVQQTVLSELEADIVDGYAEMSDDITEIPTIISEDDDWYW